jgi:plastocyanin
MIRALFRMRAATLVLAVAACAPCPIPQTQPAPATHPPAPLEPSRVEPADAQGVVEEAGSTRFVEVQIATEREGESGKFAPSEIHVRRGDVVRFRMTDGNALHNVSFAAAPNAAGVQLPADSPFLTKEGQSWQIRIDLPPGRYAFVCLAHMQTGQRGTLIVEP